MATFTEKAEDIGTRRAEMHAEATKLSTEAEESGEMSVESADRIKELLEQIKGLDDELAKLKKQHDETLEAQASLKALADATPNVSMSTAVRQGQTVAPLVPAQNAAGRIPATVRRTTLRNFASMSGEERGPEERAYRFGMYALAKASNDLPSLFNFPDAIRFAADQWGFHGIRMVHGEGAGDTTGSHVFVPEEFGTDLIRLREARGVARGLLRTRSMTSDVRTDPRRTGGLTAYAVGENSAGTESDAAYDQVKLVAKDWMVLSRMSAQLSADAAISMGDELAGELAYAFADKEDECAFNGDGTSTYAGIQGFRSRLQDVDGAGTDSAGLVTGAGSASYSALTLANFETLAGTLPSYADASPVFVCHKTFYWTVMRRLELASGGVTAAEIRERVTPQFMGYPVRISQVMPSTAAASQVCCLFGDFMQAGCLGDRQQDTISFSTEANVGGQSMWERNQIGIRGTSRWDINVHDVGDSSNAGPVVGLETGA